MLDKILFDRVLQLYPTATEVKFELNKVADVVEFSISLIIDGKKHSANKQWAEIELMASKEPMIRFLEQVIVSVVPLDGAPVS